MRSYIIPAGHPVLHFACGYLKSQGIAIPGAQGDVTSTTQLRAAGFADDLLMFMRNPLQLTMFQSLFDVYAKASGAVLSLSKSFGMRIGRLRHSRYDLPPGWVEGRDVQFTDDPVRYLGLFLGAPAAVKAVWDSRVTGKMTRRWGNWRARAMPRTRGGRNVVNDNSVLSCGWYKHGGGAMDTGASIGSETMEARSLVIL